MRAALFLSLALWGMGLPSARATEGAFSEDGKTLWMLSRWANFVLRFRAGEAAPTRFKIPGEILSGPYDSERIATGPDGLLIDGGGKLWSWKPDHPKEAPKVVAALPKDLMVGGITRPATGPYAGWILLTGWYSPATPRTAAADTPFQATLFTLRPGKDAFQAVSRTDDKSPISPAFSEGRMFYGWSGDLNEGGIKSDPHMNDGEGELWGTRVAPLGAVREIAIAGGRIWAALKDSPAALVSVPLPAQAATQTKTDLASALKTQRESLAGVSILPLAPPLVGEHGAETIDHLCGWTGKNGDWKIAFSLDGKTFWLLESGKDQPRQIGIELSIQGR